MIWGIVNKSLKFLSHLVVVLNKQPVYNTPYRKPCQRYSNIFFNIFSSVHCKVDLTAFLRVCIWSTPCIFIYMPSNAYIPFHIEWLTFVGNFYILFRFNQLCLQNFFIHKYLYISLTSILHFLKNFLAAKCQYNFTSAIEQYLHPSDTNTHISIKI